MVGTYSQNRFLQHPTCHCSHVLKTNFECIVELTVVVVIGEVVDQSNQVLVVHFCKFVE